MSPYTVSQSVKNWPKDRQPLINFSRHVYKTLERFIASGDNEAMDSHIPTTVKRRVRRIDECNAERHQVSQNKYLLKHRREYSTGIIERGCGREADKARGGAECLIRLRDHIRVQ